MTIASRPDTSFRGPFVPTGSALRSLVLLGLSLAHNGSLGRRRECNDDRLRATQPARHRLRAERGTLCRRSRYGRPGSVHLFAFATATGCALLR